MFSGTRYRAEIGQGRGREQEDLNKMQCPDTATAQKRKNEQRQKVLEAATVKSMKETSNFTEFQSAVLLSKVNQENTALLQVRKERAEREKADRLSKSEYTGGMLPKHDAVRRAEQERASKIQCHEQRVNDYNKQKMDQKERENKQRLQQDKERVEKERAQLKMEQLKAMETARRRKLAQIEHAKVNARMIQDRSVLAQRHEKEERELEERNAQLCSETQTTYKKYVQQEIDKAKAEGRMVHPLLAAKRKQETSDDRVYFARGGGCDVMPRMSTVESRKRKDVERKHVKFDDEVKCDEAQDDRVYFYRGGQPNVFPRMSSQESRKRKDLERQHVNFTEDVPCSEAKDDRVYFYRGGESDVVPRMSSKDSRLRKDIEREHVGFDQNAPCNNNLYSVSGDKWKKLQRYGSTAESNQIKEKNERQHFVLSDKCAKCPVDEAEVSKKCVAGSQKSIMEDSRLVKNGTGLTSRNISVALHAAVALAPKSKCADIKFCPTRPSTTKVLPMMPTVPKLPPIAKHERVVLPPIVPKKAPRASPIIVDQGANKGSLDKSNFFILPSIESPRLAKATPIYIPKMSSSKDAHRPNSSVKISHNYPANYPVRCSPVSGSSKQPLKSNNMAPIHGQPKPEHITSHKTKEVHSVNDIRMSRLMSLNRK